MKTISQCPICGNQHLTTYPSRFDSWTITRFLRKTPGIDRPPVIVNHCTNCGYAGVNYRFDPNEESQYYENYMTGEYVESRGVQYHAAFYHSQAYTEMRRKAAWACLSPYDDEIHSVLDFGGDTGLMIPTQFDHCEKYVLDVETRPLENNVVCVDYTTPLQVDLVMCSHTMEHISDINKAMFEITQRLKPGGILYIEVPDENPNVFDHNFVWYEHINLFNTSSLEMLFTNHQFEILDSHTLGYASPMTKSIAVIGRYSQNPIERQ